MAKTDPAGRRSLWGNPAGNDRQDGRGFGRSVRSGIATVLIAVVIIAAGITLPTLLYPHLDSYDGRLTQLTLDDDMVSGHVFGESVTLYPWDIYDEAQTRSLSSYEMDNLKQSGVADLLVNNMQLRGLQLEGSYDEYLSRTLGEFRSLDPYDSSQAGCFVLMDADIDLDGAPDVRCAVDFNGKLISLLVVSEKWTAMQLTAPIVVATEPSDVSAGEGEGEGGGTGGGESNAGADGVGADAGFAGTGEAGAENTAGTATASDTQADPSKPYEPDVDFRPQEDEENIWQFSYVLSREALAAGQMEAFTALRRLELSFEERFGYPFVNLIAAPSENVEVLPEIKEMTMTAHQLTTESYLLRVYDYSNGTRLVLYINPKNQNCDGFNLSIMPL